MIPTEFKKLKDLRQVDDKGLRPEMLLLLESGEESVSAFLSQIKSWVLNETIDSLTPVGAPIFWPNDQIPQGYAKINDGLEFNVIQYPLLALAWPSGKIPPHKGLVIECTADGSVTGDTESGEVKTHSVNINIDKIPERTIKTKGGGRHRHDGLSNHAGMGGNFENYSTQTNPPNNRGKYTSEVQDHVHELVIPEISVSAKGKYSGATRNTVDRINYNVIVRLA